MESVHVIIADRSQLVRLGITGILYQTGFPVTIREISETGKLIIVLQKEKNSLIIVSRSFLSACIPNASRIFHVNRKHFRVLLINDAPVDSTNLIDFDEIIELHDVERTIYRKMENNLQQLVKPGYSGRAAEEISQREKEVLKLVALGLTNKEIAERLFISSHTVITHRKNITAKLGIRTIAGLTVYALINKLITAEDIK